MKRYEVIFEQTEHFGIVIEANSKKEAGKKADELFNKGDYEELGDCSVEQVNIKEIKNGKRF